MSTNGIEHIGAFQSEIMNMMYVFGDVKSCNGETALLIEEIIHRQISELVKQSYQVAQLRGAKVISLTDVLFLLRKNKLKMRQLICHLQTKHLLHKYGQSKSGDTGDNVEDENEDIEQEKDAADVDYKIKYCLDFLSDVDIQSDATTQLLQTQPSGSERVLETFDVCVLNEKEIDQIKTQRQQKLDEQTKSMDLAQYSEFTESRRISFSKNVSKFKKWLDIDNILPNFKPSASIIEVFAYLAYETVQEIVELALMIKDQQLSKKTTVISNDNSAAVLYGTTPNFIMPAKDESTKISSGASTSRASVSDLQATPTASSTAIQPSHIHEVMRRYSTLAIGPHIALSSHFIKPSFTNRSLCL